MKLKLEDYHIIYDDGEEIADVLTIKEANHIIEIQMDRLKYAKEGKVSNDIGNLYEVSLTVINSSFKKSLVVHLLFVFLPLILIFS